MNSYCYKLWLPLTIVTFGSVFYFLTISEFTVNWLLVFVTWFLIGPVGIGAGFHRYFSHRQYKTYRPIELALAFLGSLAGYAPLAMWCSSHIYHHRNSDSSDDITSPHQYGFWESFLFWRLRPIALEKVDTLNFATRSIFKDKKLVFLIKNYYRIFWIFGLISFLLGPTYFLSLFLIPVQLEHLRLNMIGSFAHMKLPTSYRNFESQSLHDRSYNNVILGYLTFGFGWHNNHHHNERSSSLMVRWWEVDIEGLVCKLISKKD